MENIWESNYSKKSANVRPSPIREILSVIKQPGMISFAGGCRPPMSFPSTSFSRAFPS